MEKRRSHTRTLPVWPNGQCVGLRFAAWLVRLPQQDFCQALGVAQHLKYEADSGPGVRSLTPVLRNSVKSAKALRTFVAMRLLLGVLAAPDGHARKFSLQRLAEGRFRWALLDNVMSVWPVEGPGPGQGSWHKAKMAMPGENRHHHIKDIERRHFNALGVLCDLDKDAEPEIHQIIGRTERVIQDVSARLPQHFEPQRGRHGVPEPAARCCPTPGDALHVMTSRLAIHCCQGLHGRTRPVLHLGLTRR